MKTLSTLCFCLAASFLPLAALAADNPPELRVCSQNLFRLGEETKKSAQDPLFYQKQRSFLVTRMLRAKCDVIALQEVVGKNAKEALKTVHFVRSELELRSSRKFRPLVGAGYDEHIRNGFLIADDAGRFQASENYEREILPRLQPKAAPGRFVRSPLGVLLSVPGQNGAPEKQVFILNFHSKSKSMGYKDPSGMNFETTRMEMAEALRQILQREIERLGPEVVYVMAGDRNSDIPSASAEILSGVRTLADFESGGACRLDSQAQLECEQAEHDEILLPLFALRQKLYPGEYRGGSYLYQRRQELLDEIYILPRQMAFLRRASGRLAIGMEGDFFKGSDHKLVWAELNW